MLTSIRSLLAVRELELASLTFPSVSELVRLLISVPTLSVLRCINIKFQGKDVQPDLVRCRLDRLPGIISLTIVDTHFSLAQTLIPRYCRSLQSLCLGISNTGKNINQGTALRRHADHNQEASSPADIVTPPTTAQLRALITSATLVRDLTLRIVVHGSTLDLVLNIVSNVLQALRLPLLHNFELEIHCDSSAELALATRTKSVEGICNAIDELLLSHKFGLVHVSIHSRRQRIKLLRPQFERLFPCLHTRGILQVSTHSTTGHAESVGHDLAVDALAVSPDGRFLATGSPDATLVIWAAHPLYSSPRPAQEWLVGNAHHTARALSFSPDSRRLAICAGSVCRTIFWAPHPQQNNNDSGSGRSARWLLHPDAHATLQVWDPAAGARLLVLGRGGYVPTVCMADGAYVMDDNFTSFAHPARDAARLYRQHASAGDEPWRATHGVAHGAVSVSVPARRESRRGGESESAPRRLIAAKCVSPDGQYAAYASGDYSAVRVVRLVDGVCVRELDVHHAEVTLLAFAVLRDDRGMEKEGLVSTARDGAVCFTALQLD
ncbi:hypothetical protein BD309DRAFT_1023740 [Dichomitus squalens]|uniref:Uncharacterized protein n=1 Tax=Dichomitus squalens TaxID=114155 RepID=A0A4Q9PEC5_9APHY|nr:hypothetical protein BD309DRAFT_1023740 [Dichomitus squalens]TBU51597.1 hypothetical protein BD310DRAFT_833975 [Dichomitus squalens]